MRGVLRVWKLQFYYKGIINFYQRLVGYIRGYGTEDAPYRDWYLKFLEKRATKKDWAGVWKNGQPRPWVGGWDKRIPSDAEFREIIKQNMSKN